ncbi:MAG: OmpW family protein [Thioploca sp.]|nr:OmpW family protein [Thioploca sp.]
MDLNKLTFSILLASSLSIVSFSTLAIDTGDWLIRGRLINIDPDSSSSDVTSSKVDGVVPNTSVSVDNAYTLDIDITYMFTPNIGAELLLDLSSKHKAQSEGSQLQSLAPGDILEARVLPPALILQYHMLPQGPVRPYFGLGFNYTYFFDEEATGSLDKGLGGVSGVSLDSSFGWVAQLGVDYDMGNDWFLNADLKYMAIDTTATFDSGNLGHVSVDVDINPWVMGIGIGKRF